MGRRWSVFLLALAGSQGFADRYERKAPIFVVFTDKYWNSGWGWEEEEDGEHRRVVAAVRGCSRTRSSLFSSPISAPFANCAEVANLPVLPLLFPHEKKTKLWGAEHRPGAPLAWGKSWMSLCFGGVIQLQDLHPRKHGFLFIFFIYFLFLLCPCEQIWKKMPQTVVYFFFPFLFFFFFLGSLETACVIFSSKEDFSLTPDTHRKYSLMILVCSLLGIANTTYRAWC